MQITNLAMSSNPNHAAVVRSNWYWKTRQARRAAARRWWRSTNLRPQGITNYGEFWRLINEARGVVDASMIPARP